MSIAAGRPLTDELVHRAGKVWIHNNEDSIDELYRRVGGVLRYHEIDFGSVRQNIFVTSGLDEPLLVAIKEKDAVKRTEAVAHLIEWIGKMGIMHITLDPFVSTHRGVSENANEEIEQVVQAIRHIAHETGCSIDLVHHSLKPQVRNSEAHAGDMNASRGASSLIGAVRIVYTITSMSKSTATKMGLPPAQATRMLRLDHGKGNYSARNSSIRWFELVKVDTGGDGLMFGGETVGVPVRWNPIAVDGDAAEGDSRKTDPKETQRQRVRNFLAKTMETDRVTLSNLIGQVELEFGIGKSAARKRVMEAVTEEGGGLVQANGVLYRLTIERKKPSPPNPVFVVREIVGAENADQEIPSLAVKKAA